MENKFSHNPFDEDFNSDYYKKLLNSDSSPSNNVQDVEHVEVVETVDDFLSSNTFNGLPELASETLKQVQQVREQKSEESRKVAGAINKLFDELNVKYGLEVKLDFNSFSNSLEYLINPRNKRAMELYLSESYARFRVLLYSQYLIAIARLSSQLLDPNYICSQSLTFADKMIAVEKLFGFMKQMEEIYEKVNIPASELKLEKLSDDQHDFEDINSPDITQFLETLKNNIIEGKGNEPSQDNNI